MHPDKYVVLAIRTESPSRTLPSGAYILDEHWRAAVPEQTWRHLHGVAGIVTEIGEFFEMLDTARKLERFDDDTLRNAREELGDILWYVAILCHLYKVSLAKRLDVGYVPVAEYRDLVAHEGLVSALERETINATVASAQLLDHVKRHFFYDKELGEVSHVWFSALVGALRTIASYLYRGDWRGGMDDAMERNLAKLRKRYPDQFNITDAVERDLDAEKEALS